MCVHLGLCRNVHVWMSESHALTVNVIHPLFNDTIGLLYLFYFPLLIPLALFYRRTRAISSSWDARLTYLRHPLPFPLLQPS